MRRRDLLFPFNELGGLGCIGLVLALLVFVALLATVARVLNLVAAENRRMEPGQVWLNLIPILNFVWLVVTVERVGESIRNELVARGRDRKGDGYGKTVGHTGLVLFFTAVVPPVAVVTWPFALVYGVVYWVQLGGYARRLRDDGTAYTPPDEGW
jgi:hypothetical protein